MTTIRLPDRLFNSTPPQLPPRVEDVILVNLLPYWQPVDPHGHSSTVRVCDFTYKTSQLKAQRRPSKTIEELRGADFVVVDNNRVSRSNKKAIVEAARQKPIPRSYQVGGRKDKLSAAYQRPKSVTRQDWVRARTAISGYAVNLQPDWELAAEPSLQFLGTVNLNVKEVKLEDIVFVGSLQAYNQKLDLITPKNNVLLPKTHKKKSYDIPGCIEDDILTDVILKDPEVQVIATDQVITTLMSAPLSRFGWQIIAYRFDNQIILEKAADSNNLDVVTLYENTPMEQLKEGFQKEAAEVAAELQNEFQQFVVQGQNEVVRGEKTNPFPRTPKNRLYRYRYVTLPPSQFNAGATVTENRKKAVKIAFRAELHAANVTDDNKISEYFKIHSLNEGLVKVIGPSWVTAFDRQKGALFLSELSRNSCKFARWVYGGIIAGATIMKIGMLSTKKDDTTLLGIQSRPTMDLAQEAGIKLSNGWAVFREIIDIIFGDNRSEGRFIITRDGLSRTLKIHYTPLENEEQSDSTL